MLLCFIVLQMLIGLVLRDLGFLGDDYGDPKGSVAQVVSYGILFSVLMYFCNFDYRDLFGPVKITELRNLSILVLGIVLVLGGAWVWLGALLLALEQFLPVDSSSLIMLERLMGSGLITLITICIVAPFCEEMLFRGFILRCFLANYSAGSAIFLSAVLFSAVHMNWYQMPFALVFGLFAGWLYYRTRSLWPAIIAHVIHNTGAYTFWNFDDLPSQSSSSISTASVFVSLLGMRLLYTYLPQQSGKPS